MNAKNGRLLAAVAALFTGTPTPPARRIKRGETKGHARSSAPAHIQAERIADAEAKRARKKALRAVR